MAPSVERLWLMRGEKSCEFCVVNFVFQKMGKKMDHFPRRLCTTYLYKKICILRESIKNAEKTMIIVSRFSTSLACKILL